MQSGTKPLTSLDTGTNGLEQATNGTTEKKTAAVVFAVKRFPVSAWSMPFVPYPTAVWFSAVHQSVAEPMR
jgi:hypothetical protein